MQVGVVSQSNASLLPTGRNRCFESGRLQGKSEVPLMNTTALLKGCFTVLCFPLEWLFQLMLGFLSNHPRPARFFITNFVQDFAGKMVLANEAVKIEIC